MSANKAVSRNKINCRDDEDNESSVAIVKLVDAPPTTIQVLASCHSLMAMENRDIIGDPLERACLAATQWTLTRSE